ncbi:MAG: GNAT family N-acetyltransferase [Nitrososphaerales archaeon]
MALRPIEPSDIPLLYRAALDPSQSYRWRFRGTTPSLEQFADALYRGTLGQFAVIDRSTGSLHGLVVLYNSMPEAGWAYIAFQRVQNEEVRTGHMMVGGCLLLDYAFKNWALRKIYAEIPDYNYQALIGSTGLPVTKEGCFHDHVYFGGQYHDLHVIAIYRETWESFIAPWRSILSL